MNSKWSHFYLNPGPVTHSLISGIMKAMVYILYMFWIMQNVDCTLYLALYKSSFHWKKNTKDTCIQVYSGYFYAFYATLYLVLKCWFFLCKCLKLLYLIKELILCDLTKHKWHVFLVHIIIYNLLMMICQCFFFPNEPHFFVSQYMFIMLQSKPLGITAANCTVMHAVLPLSEMLQEGVGEASGPPDVAFEKTCR